MNKYNNKDYIDTRIVKLITSIGYIQRTGSYYAISEDDGYIIISYHVNINGPDRIQFYKNIYSTHPYPKNNIHEDFYDYSDFVSFLEKYHVKAFRKLKLEKINKAQ